MSSFSQDFIDTKLAAIRACQNRAPEKPVDKTKERMERKAQRDRERKAERPKPKAKVKSDIEDPLFELKPIAFKPERKQERAFKTKPVDYTKMILVRVNRNTQVYVDPDNYDMEALKEKYKPKPISRAEKF